MATFPLEAAQILNFWFGLHPASSADERSAAINRWFRGTPEMDAEVRRLFGGTLARAERGELDWWSETARGRLALIILFDQFTRNAHRGTAAMFSQDRKAQQLTLEGLRIGHERELNLYERLFFNLPLSHSEELALQDLAVANAERWTTGSGLEAGAGFRSEAGRLRDEIRRFGRHPMRNAVLGRVNTPEEDAWIREKRGG